MQGYEQEKYNWVYEIIVGTTRSLYKSIFFVLGYLSFPFCEHRLNGKEQ